MEIKNNQSAFKLLKTVFHKIDSGFHDPKGCKVFFDDSDLNLVNSKEIETLLKNDLVSIHKKSDLLENTKGLVFLNITERTVEYIDDTSCFN